MDVANVDLHSMLDLKQLENLLSNLIHKVTVQDKTINELKTLCQGFVPASVYSAHIHELQTTIVNLTTQLEATKDSSMSFVGGRKISAGELSAVNAMNIQKLQEASNEYSLRREVDDHFEKFSNQFKNELKLVNDSATPLELTHTLQQSFHDTTSRINNIESMTSCKLDRSELDHLESLAVRLRAYAEFQGKTERDVSALKQQVNQRKDEIISNEHSVRTEKERIDKAIADMKHFSTKGELRSVAQQLNDHNHKLTLCASSASVNELCDAMSKAQEDVKQLSSESGRHSEDIAALSSDKASRAAVQELGRLCVARSHYEAVTTALGTAVDSKAAQGHLEELQGRVQILEAELAEERQKVSVAMRFVQWFTERGENYEHNLKTIDKHMGKLASASHPSLSNNQPHSGQIRYTST